MVWSSFWSDECGAVVSAELVAVGTVAVIGGTVGLNAMGHAVNGELREMAQAVRSFNQSYAVAGHVSSRAWTAGSSYTQPDVKKSLAELDELVGDRPDNGVRPENQGDQPSKSPKKSKKKNKDQDKKAGDERAADETAGDQAAFLEADESALLPPDPVEADDDASQAEIDIESFPEA